MTNEQQYLRGLLLLEAYEKTKDASLLPQVREILLQTPKFPEATIAQKEVPYERHLYPNETVRAYENPETPAYFLVAVEEYYLLSGDPEILKLTRADVLDALTWLITTADDNEYGLIEYNNSLASVQAQVFTYRAFVGWSELVKAEKPSFSERLMEQADKLKRTYDVLLTIKEDIPTLVQYAR